MKDESRLHFWLAFVWDRPVLRVGRKKDCATRSKKAAAAAQVTWRGCCSCEGLAESCRALPRTTPDSVHLAEKMLCRVGNEVRRETIWKCDLRRVCRSRLFWLPNFDLLWSFYTLKHESSNHQTLENRIRRNFEKQILERFWRRRCKKLE